MRYIDLKDLLELFLTFFKIGLFTFGGGYAMISVIEDNAVQKKHWITDDDMMNVTVIAESTPGPIAINCATFVGAKRKGVAGAIAATVGVVLPSFLIIMLLAKVLDKLLEYQPVIWAFAGIKAAVGLLIIDAALKMIKKMEKKPLPIAILCAAAAVMIVINLCSAHFSTVILMLIAGAVSLAVFLAKGSPAPEKEGGTRS